MRRKFVAGELDVACILMEMSIITQRSRKFFEKLAMALMYTTDIDKETELNKLCYHSVKKDLGALGFVVKSSIEQNDFCLFGKSLPDLYFYKDFGGNIVQAGLLKRVLIDDIVAKQLEYGVVGGFNLKKSYPQIFADMI